MVAGDRYTPLHEPFFYWNCKFARPSPGRFATYHVKVVPANELLKLAPSEGTSDPA